MPKNQAPAPRDLRQPWPITCHVFELGPLVRDLERSGGPKITIPPYATHRKVLVSSDGTRAEVLSALADLYGWELRPERDGYHLGRARATPAKNPAELHIRMLHAIPPPVWHSAMAIRRSYTARWGRQMEYILEDADRAAGSDWKKFRVADLKPINQLRFANVLMALQIEIWYGLSGGENTAPAWIVTPEKGILRLSAPIRPGEHPLLKFEVPDENGKTHMWGYYVGTSSFDK